MLARYPSLVARHVLVTGGGSGIGAALVDAFLDQGSIVSFLDIDAKGAAQVLTRNNKSALTPPTFVPCDVTDVESLQSAILQLIDRNGPIQILVNNAANDERHDWRSVSSADWDRRLAINLKHQFFAIQAVAPEMANAGGGSIVNLSSISWILAMGGMPAYVASKSGIIGLTRSFARDLGPQNIRVNCVLPGWIMTDRQRELYVTPEAERDLLDRQCLKRLLVPEDVAALVLFLSADDSSGCTSQSFIIDAGSI